MDRLRQKAAIGERRLEYTLDPKSALYEFDLPEGRFKLRPWTWGEKNAALENSLAFDEQQDDFVLDAATFHEAMLQATIKEMSFGGETSPVEPQTIRELKADTGDTLLEICFWLNDLSEDANAGSGEAGISKETNGDGTIVINVDNRTFKLRAWTWGEKNRIMNQSVRYDARSENWVFSPKIFNELMVLTSLVSISETGKSVPLDLNELQRLDGSLGDTLLETVQEINEISPPEKKNYATS